MFDDMLAAGRALAEELMLDEGVVWRKTGQTTQDETTGREMPVYTPAHTGPCKVQDRSGANVREASSGGQIVAVRRLEVHFPVSAPEIREDDEVEVTSSGRRFRIVGPTGKTFQTAARYIVEEL